MLAFSAALILVACSDGSGPSSPVNGFAIEVALPGLPATMVRGDSTAWTYVATPMRTPFLVASLTSFDSLGGGPAPVFFTLSQNWPAMSNGGLQGGTYMLAAPDSNVMSFGLCYPTTSSSQTCTSSDSGTIRIVAPAGDSVIQGSVDAWLSEYRPGTGPSFHVRGSFRIEPNQ
jgi:hypothetical protein